MLRGMETLFRRSQGLVLNMDRSQKLGILHEDTKVKLKAG